MVNVNSCNDGVRSMNRYALLFSGLLTAFLGLFLLVEGLHIPLLVDPSAQMDERGIGSAMVGVGLLIVDVFLPVPSSLVMLAHGALFGTVLGTLLSLIGSTGAASVGFAIGRANRITLSRYITAEEQARAEVLFRRWGWMAIVVSRPIPMLAEAMVIVAGTSSMPWSVLLASTIAGVLPASFLYALTGAYAVQLDNFLLIFAVVLGIAALGWLVSYVVVAKQTKEVL